MHRELEEHLQRCCVQITVGDERGTGFFVAPNAILTCAHVVEKRSERVPVEVTWEGRSLPVASVVATSRTYPDLARIEIGAPTGEAFPEPPLVRLREDVCIKDEGYAYGFSDYRPLGDPALVTLEGRTGPPERRIKLKGGQIRPRMSGGPVLNLRTAEVCGIVQKSRDIGTDLGGIALGVAEILAFLGDMREAERWHAKDGRWEALARAHRGEGPARLPPAPGVERFLAEYLGTADNPVPFGGRAHELAALDAWLEDAPEPCLLLSAPAGRGKSALLVRWVERLRARPSVAIVFFPISVRFRTNLARSALPALIAGVASAYGIPAPGQFDASIPSWKATLSALLARSPPAGTQLLIVLDGIDEAADWEVDQDLFPLELPPRVRVVASARAGAQDTDTEHWLRALGWDHHGWARAMDLHALTPEGVADVLVRMGVPLDQLGKRVDIVAEIHRLTEGDPLLVGLYVGDLWAQGEGATRLQPADLATIRPGLEGYFKRWWDDQRRLWQGEAPLKALGLSMTVNILASALGPLSRDDVLRLLPAEAEIGSSLALADTLAPMSRFLVGDGLQAGYAFSHPRLASYFHAQMGVEERARWEGRFLAWGREVLARVAHQPPTERDRYAVQFYGAHLVRSEAPAEDLLALVDARWMRAWVRLSGGYAGFLADVARAHQRAIRHNQEAVARGEPPRLEWEVLCTLWQTSINSLVRDIPIELTVALVQDGIWTVADGIAHARRLPSIQERAMAIAAMTGALPAERRSDLHGEIMRIAGEASATADWPGVMEALKPYLPAGLWYDAAPISYGWREPVVQVEDASPARTNRDRDPFQALFSYFESALDDLPEPERAFLDEVMPLVAWVAVRGSEGLDRTLEALMSHAYGHGHFALGRLAEELTRVVRDSMSFGLDDVEAADRMARWSPLLRLVLSSHVPDEVRIHLLRGAVRELAGGGPEGLLVDLARALDLPVEAEPWSALDALAPAMRMLRERLLPAPEAPGEATDGGTIAVGALPEPDVEPIDIASVIPRFLAAGPPGSRRAWLANVLALMPETERAAAIDRLVADAAAIDEAGARRAVLVMLLASDPRADQPIPADLALEILLGSAQGSDKLPGVVVRRLLLTVPSLREALVPERIAALIARSVTQSNELQAALLVVPAQLRAQVWSALPPALHAFEPPGSATGVVLADLDDAPDAESFTELLMLPVLALTVPGWTARQHEAWEAASPSLRNQLRFVVALGRDDDAVRARLAAQRSEEPDPVWSAMRAVLLDGPGEGRIEGAMAHLDEMPPGDCALACVLLAPDAPGAVLGVVRRRFEREERGLLLARLWPHLPSPDRDTVLDDLALLLRDEPKLSFLFGGIVHDDEPTLRLLAAVACLSALEGDTEDREATAAIAAPLMAQVRAPLVLYAALRQACWSGPGAGDAWPAWLFARMTATDAGIVADRLAASAHAIKALDERRSFLVAVLGSDPRVAGPIAPELAIFLLASDEKLPDAVARRVLLTVPSLREALVPERLAALIARSVSGEDVYGIMIVVPARLRAAVWDALPPALRTGEPPSDATNVAFASIDDEPDDDFLKELVMLPVLALTVPSWAARQHEAWEAASPSLRDQLRFVVALGRDDDAVRARLAAQRSDEPDSDPVWSALRAVLLDGPAEGRIEGAVARLDGMDLTDCALACVLLARDAPGAVLGVIRRRFHGAARNALCARISQDLDETHRGEACDEILSGGFDTWEEDAAFIAIVHAAADDDPTLWLAASMMCLEKLESSAGDRRRTVEIAAGLLPRVRRPTDLYLALRRACETMGEPEDPAEALAAVSAATPTEVLWAVVDLAAGGLLGALERPIPRCARWRTDRDWLLENTRGEPDECVARVFEGLREDELARAVLALEGVPEAIVDRFVALVAPRARGGIADALLQLLGARSDAHDRAAVTSRLLGEAHPDLAPRLEVAWANAALASARSCGTPADAEKLHAIVTRATPHLSPRSHAMLCDVVRLVPPLALRVSLLAKLAPSLPAADLPAIVREVVDACASLDDRKQRLALLLQLSRGVLGPARRPVLEEALRTTQTIDDGRERTEALVALARWADDRAKAQALDGIAEVIDPATRARLLSALAPCLPEHARAAVRDALAAAKIGNWLTQSDSLRVVLEHLPSVTLPEVFAFVDDIPQERDRARALCLIAPRLDAAMLDRACRAARALRTDAERVRALLGIAEHLDPDRRKEELASVAVGLRDVAAAAHLAVGRMRWVAEGDRAAAVAEAEEALRATDAYRGRRADVLALAAEVPARSVPAFVKTARRGGAPEDFVQVAAALAARGDVDDRAEVVAEACAALSTIAECDRRARALAAIAPWMPADQRAVELRATLAEARRSWSFQKRVAGVAAVAVLLPPEVLREELEVALAHPDRGTRLAALELLSAVLPEGLQREALRLVSAAARESLAEELLALGRSLSPALAPDLLAAARLVRESDRQAELVSLGSMASTALPPTVHYRRISQSLQVLASSTRAGFLSNLGALAPALVELGGAGIAQRSAELVSEAANWW
jgi:hypothetical protein